MSKSSCDGVGGSQPLSVHPLPADFPLSEASLAQVELRIAHLERREQLEKIQLQLERPGFLSELRQLRSRVSAIQGSRRAKKRQRLGKLNRISPELAKFWSTMCFPEFIQEFAHSVRDGELSFDRHLWSQFFAGVWSIKAVDPELTERAELEIVDSGTPFGVRLGELRQMHSDWPFVVGNLDVPAWLRILSSDPDPKAAEVYFVVSRGFQILPPELADSFESNDADNYRSAEDNSTEVDAEIQRLFTAGFIDDFHKVLEDLGLPSDTVPNVLSIGAVIKKGKTRIVIDPSRPEGRSVNEAVEPDETVLPNAAMAMAALPLCGMGWSVDFTDAFLNHVLQRSSVRLCCIRWRGRLYAYKRLGFGFSSGPSQQQSTTLAVVRALSRRLQALGCKCADPPAMSQRYPHIAAKPGNHFVSALLAFLDDLGGFSGTPATAWFSFVHYLLLCKELSLPVAFKPGKTDPPARLLKFLGLCFDFKRGLVFLDDERLAKLRSELDSFDEADSVSVRELQSLIGVLVFCSVVIRLGRLHYHALIDALADLGPSPHPKRRVNLALPLKENIRMWRKLLSLLNARSARTRTLRPTVPTAAATDASLTGWGWSGMGQFEYDAWPADWKDKLGRALPHHPKGADRIFICECEAWALLFLCRRLLPKCVGCHLVVKVDNLPVVRMCNKFSTRSKACLPVLQEVCWLAAMYDVELEIQWIDTASNCFPDLLSRRFDPDFDQEEWDRLMAKFAPSVAEIAYWKQHWPDLSPARPELRPHLPVADVRKFSSAWAALSPEELERILPAYLQ